MRIPVGKAIVESFGFVFGRYFTLLGIAWLPMLILDAASFLVMRPYYRDAMAPPLQSAEMVPMASSHTYPAVLLINLAILVVGAIIAAGIAREAMGTRSGPRFVYLRFGQEELRVAASLLLLMLLVYGAFLVVVVFGGVLGGIIVGVLAASGQTPQHFDTVRVATEVLAIVGLVSLVFGAAILYFSVRLSYFMIPVCVAEQRIGLLRSWQLTRANFWRALGVMFVASLPVFVLDFVLLVVSLGPEYFAAFTHVTDQQLVATLLRHSFQRQWQVLPYTTVLGILFAPITYGLLVAPGVFTYRALVSESGT